MPLLSQMRKKYFHAEIEGVQLITAGGQWLHKMAVFSPELLFWPTVYEPDAKGSVTF